MVPLWVKLLASQLEQRDIVEFANIRRTTVEAVYRTGVREIYYFEVRKRKRRSGDNCFVVTPQTAAIKEDIPLFKEFDNDPLGESPDYHWRINRNQFNEATLVEQRIAMHRLLRELINARYEPDQYPECILDEDWRRLQATKFDRYLVDGSITCYPLGRQCSPHHRILEHFFHAGVNLSSSALWSAVTETCSRKTVPINSTSIRRVARWFGWFESQRMISPLAYCALFKALKVTGAVADLHPNTGSKAVACALLGLPYRAVEHEQFQRALELGFASFLKMDFEWFKGQSVELLISDCNFNGFQMPPRGRLDQARRMLCYVPREKRAKLANRLNPVAALQIYDCAATSMTLQNPNYLFLW